MTNTMENPTTKTTKTTTTKRKRKFKIRLLMKILGVLSKTRYETRLKSRDNDKPILPTLPYE